MGAASSGNGGNLNEKQAMRKRLYVVVGRKWRGLSCISRCIKHPPQHQEHITTTIIIITTTIEIIVTINRIMATIIVIINVPAIIIQTILIAVIILTTITPTPNIPHPIHPE